MMFRFPVTMAQLPDQKQATAAAQTHMSSPTLTLGPVSLMGAGVDLNQLVMSSSMTTVSEITLLAHVF